MKRALLLLIGIATLLAVSASSRAGGRSQEGTVLPVEDLARLAKKVETVAAERGAKVFLVARVGRPQSELPDGVEYTHVSFGVYSSITLDDGRRIPGYSIYNLYQDDELPQRSHLQVDFPIDFLAGAHVAKAGVLIPTPELQQRLLDVIAGDTWQQVHNPNYSAFSNPYNDKFQNCTEFVLDVINAAIYETTDMKQLKANARAHFTAQTIRINPFKLFFASLFMPEIRTSDHGGGPIRTVTFQTLADYLAQNGLAAEVMTVEL